jgi:predicted Zn finger-like uncharacterized protein
MKDNELDPGRVKIVCRVCRSEFLVDHASITMNGLVRCSACAAICSARVRDPPPAAA